MFSLKKLMIIVLSLILFHLSEMALHSQIILLFWWGISVSNNWIALYGRQGILRRGKRFSWARVGVWQGSWALGEFGRIM
jgi:hypothetical protein